MLVFWICCVAVCYDGWFAVCLVVFECVRLMMFGFGFAF